LVVGGWWVVVRCSLFVRGDRLKGKGAGGEVVGGW
jgi:hypothetical protein